MSGSEVKPTVSEAILNDLIEKEKQNGLGKEHEDGPQKTESQVMKDMMEIAKKPEEKKSDEMPKPPTQKRRNSLTNLLFGHDEENGEKKEEQEKKEGEGEKKEEGEGEKKEEGEGEKKEEGEGEKKDEGEGEKKEEHHHHHLFPIPHHHHHHHHHEKKLGFFSWHPEKDFATSEFAKSLEEACEHAHKASQKGHQVSTFTASCGNGELFKEIPESFHRIALTHKEGVSVVDKMPEKIREVVRKTEYFDVWSWFESVESLIYVEETKEKADSKWFGEDRFYFYSEKHKVWVMLTRKWHQFE